jgi:hypothetical protein
LTVEIQKCSNIIFEAGKDGQLPLYILRAFVKTEDLLTNTTSEQKKKFNKLNSVSYNKLKQKLKKYLQATGPLENTYEQ